MPPWAVAAAVLGGIAAAVIAAAAAAYVFARRVFRHTFFRHPHRVPAHPNEAQRQEAALTAAAAEWVTGQPHEEVTLTGEGGTALFGIYLDIGADKTAVLVHGYTTDWKSRAYNARLYRALGFNVLLPDNAGHGRSGGELITMGYLDAPNLLYWADWLTRTKNARKIVLDGVSMGAAAVLATSNYERRPAVCGLVADCGFTSAYDEIRSQFRRRRVPAFPALAFLCRMARRRGFDLKARSPIEGVRRSEVPTLFIHGDKDKFVPFSMVRELYDANASPKRLLVTENVGHAFSYILARERYEEAITRFVREVTEE